MQLIYLAPVPWGSFAQRPHHCVRWFHARTGAQVLWVDPYPTRLPTRDDWRRVRPAASVEAPPQPPWLAVRRPPALPVEPLSGGRRLNRWLWRDLLDEIVAFAARDESRIGIGKPSALAVDLLDRLPSSTSFYDAMDDFPAFYQGWSRRAMARQEAVIASQVTTMIVSSTALMQRWQGTRADVRLVRNGLDPSVLPIERADGPARPVFGYVGTIGRWFDWSMVIAIAQARPADLIRLIGPVAVGPGRTLPGNIELRPACDHATAVHAMTGFTVGLIPFLQTSLTASVDPIKYYEYRALGLPVVATPFGEMALRRDEPGTYLASTAGETHVAIEAALAYEPDPATTRQFITDNAWSARYAAAGLVE